MVVKLLRYPKQCILSCVPNCRGLRVDRAGRSPWLVSNALTAEPVDPEWTVLVERFRLCRQLARTSREWQSLADPVAPGTSRSLQRSHT